MVNVFICSMSNLVDSKVGVRVKYYQLMRNKEPHKLEVGLKGLSN